MSTAAANNYSTFLTTASSIAAVTAVSLWVLQTDFSSRRLLSSKSLQRKRVQEYLYRWDWALKKAVLKDARCGHDQQMDRTITEVFFKDEDISEFIRSKLLVVSKNKGSSNNDVTILSIEPDDDDGEYYVFLKNTTTGDLYQLPLVKFGMQLSSVMDEQLTSTALCFIADASSGLGTSLLPTLLTESKAGVAVIREPLWMALFANLVEKELIGMEKMERILFGLCRFDAWRVRDQVGSARTVVFTLPGQACTPVLVPLLQAVFPCERHLFAYDGCISSVKRALVWRKQGGSDKSHATKSASSDNSSNYDTIAFHNVISATTPVSRISLTASIRTLADKLAKLPLHMADTTETWMTSVDAFFRMKEEEGTNDYLPYVLKLSLLVNDESLDAPDSMRRLALTNVLQFATGSRSRPIPGAVLDAAVESLRDYTANIPTPPDLSNKQCALIEDCVFQHKLILIENKTLKDTVMPKKEWSLKAAKRMVGCACCAPEEGEEEELSNVAKQEANRTSRPKFVDGKTTFAFDPTVFQ